MELLKGSERFPQTDAALQEVKRESVTEKPVHRNQGTRWTNLLAYLCLASFRDRNEKYPLFIQFNWDLALDRALYLYRWASISRTEQICKLPEEDLRWLPWYGTQNKGIVDYTKCPRLARPHGGINWVNNEKRKEKKNRKRETRPIAESEINEVCIPMYGAGGPDKDVWVDTPLVYGDFPTETLAGCRQGDLMEIVPPTWRKQATKPVYEAQWGHINQALQSVRRIVFIGYSLPKTDLYFRHFLALSLADNPHLPKVYVLNPDIEEPGGVRENYLDMFAPLAHEGRLYGIAGRFGDPAFFDLHRALDLAKRIES